MSCAPCEQRQARLLAWANSHSSLLTVALLAAALVAIAPILKRQEINA